MNKENNNNKNSPTRGKEKFLPKGKPGISYVELKNKLFT